MSDDLYGTRNPNYSPRFKVYVSGRDDRDPEWPVQLTFEDRKYLDSDGYPIQARAGGLTWEVAFKVAGQYIDEACKAKGCVF